MQARLWEASQARIFASLPVIAKLAYLILTVCAIIYIYIYIAAFVCVVVSLCVHVHTRVSPLYLQECDMHLGSESLIPPD